MRHTFSLTILKRFILAPSDILSSFQRLECDVNASVPVAPTHDAVVAGPPNHTDAFSESMGDPVATPVALPHDPIRQVVALIQQLDERFANALSVATSQDDVVLKLRHELADATLSCTQLRIQNDGLARELAQARVRATVATHPGGDESFSWEDRKSKVLRELEDGTFDAESFLVSAQQQTSQIAGLDPNISRLDDEDADTFLSRLIAELARNIELVACRDSELSELRFLLQSQVDNQKGDQVVGAAAIAGIIDADELIQQERQRLTDLKLEWEEKFRQAEVAASLERAKLSRERQDIAKRSALLEEQLDDLQRQKQALQRETAGQNHAEPRRRWLTELGILADPKS